MIIVGIDTGKTIGYAKYNTEEKSISLHEFDDMIEVKNRIFCDNPETLIFERILHYSMGMDAAVIRAASEIGFFCCVAHDIGAKVLYYTARQWKNRLCPQPKITKAQRQAGAKPQKITDSIVRQKIVNVFNLKKAGFHSASAAGMIYAHIIDQAKKEQAKKRGKND